jgi:hypothetical protein
MYKFSNIFFGFRNLPKFLCELFCFQTFTINNRGGAKFYIYEQQEFDYGYKSKCNYLKRTKTKFEKQAVWHTHFWNM